MALLDDVRAAARSLRRSPGLSALAISILAASMAGTTVLFGIVELTLLRPLPFAHEEQLVRIHEGVAALPATSTRPGTCPTRRTPRRIRRSRCT